jgi:hypothetical protein
MDDCKLRAQFWQLMLEFRRVIYRMFFSDDARFNENGIKNTLNSHLQSVDNPRETTESSLLASSILREYLMLSDRKPVY